MRKRNTTCQKALWSYTCICHPLCQLGAHSEQRGRSPQMGGASIVWPAPSASAPVGSCGSALMLAAAHGSHVACKRQVDKPAVGLSVCMLCTAAVRGAGAGRLPVSAGQRLGGGRHHQGGISNVMSRETAWSLCFTLFSQRLGGGCLVKVGGRRPPAPVGWIKPPHWLWHTCRLPASHLSALSSCMLGAHAACQRRSSNPSPFYLCQLCIVLSVL